MSSTPGPLGLRALSGADAADAADAADPADPAGPVGPANPADAPGLGDGAERAVAAGAIRCDRAAQPRRVGRGGQSCPGDRAGESRRLGRAGRAGCLAGALFIVSGVVTALSAALPSYARANRALLVAFGVGAAVAGALAVVAPWDQWGQRSTLVLVPVALVTIAGANHVGFSPFTYPIYWVVVFCWVGATQAKGTSLRVAPLACLAYLVPLVAPPIGHAIGAAELVSSLVEVIAVCVVVGETIAATYARADAARQSAEGRAELLSALARSAPLVGVLDSSAVLSGVVDTLVALGFEAASLCVLDPVGPGYRVVESHGRSVTDATFVDKAKFVTDALAAVRQHDGVVLLDDAGSAGCAGGSASNRRRVIAAPVRVGGQLEAVLLAGVAPGADPGAETGDEPGAEAVALLAQQAGWALDNARRYAEERRVKDLMVEAARRDQLTGVGNRRHATSLLDRLRPGDALIVLDLDHFKNVNDAHGHQAGDEVLAELGEHLRGFLGDPDLSARWGGEEFIVVLGGVGEAAGARADAMIEDWRARLPGTTYSAGVALHLPGSAAWETLSRADEALYLAKRLGRDRVVSADLVSLGGRVETCA